MASPPGGPIGPNAAPLRCTGAPAAIRLPPFFKPIQSNYRVGCLVGQAPERAFPDSGKALGNPVTWPTQDRPGHRFQVAAFPRAIARHSRSPRAAAGLVEPHLAQFSGCPPVVVSNIAQDCPRLSRPRPSMEIPRRRRKKGPLPAAALPITTFRFQGPPGARPFSKTRWSSEGVSLV